MGIPMARIEFLDTACVRAVNAYAGMELPETPHLLVEFHGSDSAVGEQARAFGEIVEDHGGAGFEWAQRPEDRTALWTMRHNAFYAILALRPGCRSIVTDVCVPISHLAEAVEGTIADLAEHGVTGPILGHVGDGNFHAILMFDPADPDEEARAHAAAARMVDRALALGGTCTGEHGIGLGKRGYMAREHGAGWEVMGLVKHALDPGNIMNPGKLVPDAT